MAERKNENEKSSSDFTKFAEIENFGERLQNIKQPAMCCLNLKDLKVNLIDIPYEGEARLFPAQPAFVDEDCLVFMGIDVGSRKLGMTYIYCRPTAIYLFNLLSNDPASNYIII